MLKLHSISSKLLLESLLIVGVSLILLNIVWINFVVPSKRQDLSNLQLAASRQGADKIEGFVTTRLNQLTNIINVTDFLNLSSDQKTEIFNQLIKNDPATEEVDFMDDTGKEIIKTSRLKFFKPEDYQNQANNEHLSTVMKGQNYISPPYFNNSVPYLMIVIPVFDAKQDVMGMVHAEVNLTTLWDSISTIKPTPNGFDYVVDSRGTLIAYPDFSEVLKNQNFYQRPCIKEVLTKSSPCTSTGTSGNYTNQKGVSVYAVGVPIKSLGWAVMAESPASEAMAPINQIIFFSIGTIAFSLIWVVIISFWFSRRITSPIKELEKGAQTIGQGSLDYHLNIKTDDEIEQVANSFNQMATKLANSYTNLEDKVKERTKELSIRSEEVSAERNKLAVILEGISDGVIALNYSGQIILFNKPAEVILGVKADKVIGKYIGELLNFYDNTRLIPIDEINP
ncbi:HAMP domain-containing protein, partial [Candidatus Daviesbacteria bacterium]|nr:HAMP domain-containing protein [Candidatus Daviesbacteria bacterium]